MSSRFQPGQFLRPRSEDEAVKLLEEFGDRAKVIAGGTGIYELANRELLSDVEALIDISGIGLSYVRREGDWTRIGAGTTMAEMLGSEELRRPELRALGDALRAIQPLQVKNVATVGGAICSALPFFDLPVALMAVGAEVVLAPGGRNVPLTEFVRGYFDIDLSEGEFVREARVKSGDGDRGSAFQKFALTSDDWAVANCAVSVRLYGGRLRESRVVFGGGFGAKPTKALSVEKKLDGSAPDEATLRAAFEPDKLKELEPVSDVKASAEYRRHLASVLGRRTVGLAAERAKGGR